MKKYYFPLINYQFCLHRILPPKNEKNKVNSTKKRVVEKNEKLYFQEMAKRLKWGDRAFFTRRCEKLMHYKLSNRNIPRQIKNTKRMCDLLSELPCTNRGKEKLNDLRVKGRQFLTNEISHPSRYGRNRKRNFCGCVNFSQNGAKIEIYDKIYAT